MRFELVELLTMVTDKILSSIDWNLNVFCDSEFKWLSFGTMLRQFRWKMFEIIHAIAFFVLDFHFHFFNFINQFFQHNFHFIACNQKIITGLAGDSSSLYSFYFCLFFFFFFFFLFYLPPALFGLNGKRKTEFSLHLDIVSSFEFVFSFSLYL